MPHPVGGAMGVICHDDIKEITRPVYIFSLNIHKNIRHFNSCAGFA